MKVMYMGKIPRKANGSIAMSRLFDRAEMRCTICDAIAGQCDCWVSCSCGWSYERGGRCRNPKHKEE